MGLPVSPRICPLQSLRSPPKVAITTAAAPSSGFFLRSPMPVSKKREFSNEYMETFRDFRRNWCEHRSPQRLLTHEKPAICGHFCTKKIIFYKSRTGWLGREDSNLRMGESKSPALPLGDAPIALNGSRQDPVPPPRAAHCRKAAGRLPSGNPEPHRFTVAAQVLEHFPAKWKPAFLVGKCRQKRKNRADSSDRTGLRLARRCWERRKIEADLGVPAGHQAAWHT